MRIRVKAPTAAQLIKELQPHLPLPVYLTPEICASLHAKGKEIRPDEELRVCSLFDSGDLGGILCALANQEDEREPVVASLTHRRIRPDHPMRLRVEAYQRERVRKLARQR